jgi:hypothetical protein
MSASTLYVSNFPPEIAKQELGDLFTQFGQIMTIEHGVNQKFNVPYFLVTMQTDKAARQANHALNGHRIDSLRLAISYPEIDPDAVARGLSSNQRQTAEFVVLELNEKYRKPVRRIHTLILVCGHSFTLNMLDLAKEVERNGGMMTVDGSRRRTLGGVFFSLVNRNVSPAIYQLIHTRGGKLPGYRIEDDRVFYHLIVNPHENDVVS